MKSKHEILSLEYHKAIAQKIRETPALIQKARDNLSRLLELNGENRHSQEWGIILKAPVDLVCAFLESDGEHADELRHASVCSGILTPQERADIWSRTFDRPFPVVSDVQI
jgi:hypothetical protein